MNFSFNDVAFKSRIENQGSVCTAGAGRKTRVQRFGVGVPHLFLCNGDSMKELSIFIDGSGDFGEYDVHSPY